MIIIKTYTSNGVKLAIVRYADGSETVINYKYLPKQLKK
jgi:hypothetical protein